MSRLYAKHHLYSLAQTRTHTSLIYPAAQNKYTNQEFEFIFNLKYNQTDTLVGLTKHLQPAPRVTSCTTVLYYTINNEPSQQGKY